MVEKKEREEIEKKWKKIIASRRDEFLEVVHDIENLRFKISNIAFIEYKRNMGENEKVKKYRGLIAILRQAEDNLEDAARYYVAAVTSKFYEIYEANIGVAAENLRRAKEIIEAVTVLGGEEVEPFRSQFEDIQKKMEDLTRFFM